MKYYRLLDMTLAEQEAAHAKGARFPEHGAKQLDAHGLFLYELHLLCQKHNVVLSHEDGHGSGIVEDAEPGKGGCDIGFCFEEF